MPSPARRKPVGLEAIRQGRDERQRGALLRRVSPHFWLFAAVGALASILLYYWQNERVMNDAKVALLAKRNAVAATLGAEWYPLRDRIEKFTVASAGAFGGDRVEPGELGDFRSDPGIYLRLRVAEARDVESVRKAAGASLRDGFVACLLRQRALTPKADAGPEAGEPQQPWNLRQAYASTRILSDDWVNEVKLASDTLRLRVFQQQYDKAIGAEIPVAVEVVKTARFFLLVLDEDVDEAKEKTDGGAITMEALQLVAHPTRVYVFDLRKGDEAIRLRRTAAGSFLFAGERAPKSEETQHAMQRQVNNCSLARQVRDAVFADAPRDTGAPR